MTFQTLIGAHPHSNKVAYLCQNFKLFSSLIEIYKTISHQVRDGCINHCQVCEECAQVWNCTMTDALQCIKTSRNYIITFFCFKKHYL